MVKERKGLIERLKTRKTIILREPLLARLERKRHGSPEETQGSSVKGNCEKVYFYRYIHHLSVPEIVRKLNMEQKDVVFCIRLLGREPVPEETEGSPRDWDKVIGTSSSSKESVTSEKSTYQMFVEKASRELAEAKEHLKRYGEMTECSWCRTKSEQLAKMTEQLEALEPLAEEFSEKVGALEAEELQKLSEEITQIREWLEKAAGNPANKFHVRYIDQTTGKTVEKTIPDIEQYELYRLQREGKINIIEIHSVK